MNLYDMYTFEELKNVAEQLVLEELGRQLDERSDDGVQITEDSVLDMAAYALNNVTPMYRVNLLGRLYADSFSVQHREEIEKAVRTAIEKISDDYR